MGAADRLDAELDRITALFRNPPQLELIAGKLVAESGPIRVVACAAANGAEALSLFLALRRRDRDLQLEIHVGDIDARYVDRARKLQFASRAFPPALPPEGFDEYLEPVDRNEWRLRDEHRGAFDFEAYDLVVERPPMGGAPVDLALCQNLLIHLDAAQARSALDNLLSALRPGGYAALGGGPLDLVGPEMARRGLEPVLDDVGRIHEAWTVQRGFFSNARPPYWALEPFDPSHPDGAARYCTLFRRPAQPAAPLTQHST